MNGYIKLDIGGKERGFKIGLYTLSETMKALSIGIEQIQYALENNPVEAVALLMYNSAYFNARLSGEVVDFTLINAYAWIDEAGGLDSAPIVAFINTCIESFTKDVPEGKPLTEEQKKS